MSGSSAPWGIGRALLGAALVFAAGFVLLGVSVVLPVVLTGGSGTVTGGPAVLIGLSMFGGFGLMLLSPVVLGVMLLVSALTRSRSGSPPQGRSPAQDSISPPVVPLPSVSPLPDEFSPGAVRNWLSSLADESDGALLPPPGLPPTPEGVDAAQLPPPDPRVKRELDWDDVGSGPRVVSDPLLDKVSGVMSAIGRLSSAVVPVGIGVALWVLLIWPWFGPTWFLDPVPTSAQVVSVERSPGPDVLCGYVVRYQAAGVEVVSSTHATSSGNCDIAVGQELDLAYSQANPVLWREAGVPLTMLIPLGVFGFLGLVMWGTLRRGGVRRRWGSRRLL